jgi:hypothetical protein
MRTDSSPLSLTAPTSPAPRHPFDRWLWENRISQRAGAVRIGVSNTWLGRFLLPPDDPKYVRPSPEIIAAIAEMTCGVVGETDWPKAADARP